ncbi:MAG: ATP-dependent chaperone ClpB, partial [Isosphaeraceae bacterium]
LNRIDETIIFHPLRIEELTKIVDIQLRRLESQLAEAGIKIQVTDEARRKLAEEGFDPAYGARPLKRIIQQRLANRLASELLSNRIGENGTVEIGWEGHDFSFRPLSASESVPGGSTETEP